MPVIEYKCPNCGGNMLFDGDSGMLTCESCGRQDNIEEKLDPIAQQVFEKDEAIEYQCTSCGAVLITNKDTSATVCSFCGSPVVLGDRLSGQLAPSMVIPFTVTEQEAIQAFRKWCKRGLLTPSGFMTADRIKEITGIYVPFWLYDLHHDAEVYGEGTKVRSYTRGDYHITETEYYDVYRRLKLNYVKVPVDAADKMDDTLMDKLEPFYYEHLKEFKTPYLSGYMAEKYSQNDTQLLPRAKDKVIGYIRSAIKDSVSGYTTMNYSNQRIATTHASARYVLLPVWILTYDYNRQEHMFAMNGQTGKVVGKPPLSKIKIFSWFTGISAGTLLILKLISLSMGGGFL